MNVLSTPHRLAFMNTLRQKTAQLQNESLSSLLAEWKANLEQKEEDAASCSAQADSARMEKELLEKQMMTMKAEWMSVETALQKHREVKWEEEREMDESSEVVEEEERIAKQLQEEEEEVQRCAEKMSGKGRQKRRRRVVETEEELRRVEEELKGLKNKQTELMREMGLLGVARQSNQKQSLTDMRADVDVEERGRT